MATSKTSDNTNGKKSNVNDAAETPAAISAQNPEGKKEGGESPIDQVRKVEPTEPNIAPEKSWGELEFLEYIYKIQDDGKFHSPITPMIKKRIEDLKK